MIENPDQPSIPIPDVLSSKSGTVARGEAKRELVSRQPHGVDLKRCHRTDLTQDAPAVKSMSEDLSKIREAHQREKAAGKCVS